MADQAERIHPPSVRRRRQATEQGQRAPAGALPGAGGAFVLVLLLGTRMASLSGGFVAWTASVWASGYGARAPATLLAEGLRALLWPLFVAAGVTLALGAVVGGGLSLAALQPRPDRIGPGAWLSRNFSGQAFSGFGRQLVAAGAALLIGAGAVGVLIRQAGTLFGLSGATLAVAAGGLYSLLWRGLAAGVVIAVAERALLGWQFARSQRMTAQELKDERRQTEGDPFVRRRQRRLRRDLLRRRQLLDVPRATAVVVNPEHYAVAIRYVPGATAAPVVLAMGIDDFALRIRSVAYAHGVPIRQDPGLARSLFAVCRVGRPVPRDLWRAIAVVVVWALRGPAGQRQSTAARGWND